MLNQWSVRRLKEAGADCVKVLIYYTPFDTKEINDEKHAFVERIGDECRANDIPFFLEFVGYDPRAATRRARSSRSGSRRWSRAAWRSSPRIAYGVDVMKVEVPVNMKFVEGAQRVRGHEGLFAAGGDGRLPAAADVATKPFIYLSAGVSNAEFTESLELAAEAGVRFSGRSMRPCDLEGRNPRLRQAGWRGVPGVARVGRREEHQQREQAAQGRHALVRGPRRRDGRSPLALAFFHGVQGGIFRPAHAIPATFFM